MDENTKPKIFIAAFPAPSWGGDSVLSTALAEDGTRICEHISSNINWAYHDMGYVDSEWKHDFYRAHYPDGYELVWVDEPKEHEGWQMALVINRQKKAQEDGVN